jgi:hypothetical protein
MNEFLAMTTAQRRRRRNQASDRLQMAWIAAIVGASLGTLLTLWEAFDTGRWVTTLPYISAVGFNVWLAWMVRQYQSQIAAGLLLLNAFVTPVALLIQTGNPTVLIVAMAFIVVYFRAFQATMDMAELRSAERIEQAV